MGKLTIKETFMSPPKMHILAIMLLISAMAGIAAADDPFARIRSENEVKKQKLIADVTTALGQAGKLESSDPVQARDVLRSAQAKLESDFLLPQTERQRLLANVANRLTIINDAVRAKQRDEDLAAEKAAVKLQQQINERPPQPKRDPNDVANNFISGAKGGLDANASDRNLREKRFLDTQRDLDYSATQITEQPITERFLAISEMRKPKLSKQEQHVMKMLNSTLTVNLENASFKEVIEYLQERTEMAILVDEGSLREVGVEYSDPASIKYPKLTVRTILRKVLADKGLTYFVKEGAVHVVSIQRARENMVVRTYPISELLAVNPAYGPFFGRAVMYQQVQQLINSIQLSVDPAIWQQGGNITFVEAPLPALIIRAPAEFHYSMPGYGG